ncbi:hypothetical protein [Cellulomonas shaoxiangyii]|uniref:Uncharacterized protein n=1 Tax=Cellulomonas shaoxiangyii TaxID=2566013 RepID=A0A4P7SLF9_9CELL|nr:hypothetical protein [Cellulomonas shaoxiangyii]QCB94026.1 hypothetical protein E5225_11065 [Cellulomonas shaoxiangyii]TGY85785.1 hypothetical protein E5226_05120 [Cellulomonas shaoxiangyii]
MGEAVHRRAIASAVRSCVYELVARDFEATKNDAARARPIPCQVSLVKYPNPQAGTGPEYDWIVTFANPGTAVKNGRIAMGLFAFHQSFQRGTDRYEMGVAGQLEAFSEDFRAHTLPFVESVTSHRDLLLVLLEHRVRMSPDTPDLEQFGRAKAALDLLAYGQLVPADAELAKQVIHRAIADGPSDLVRRHVVEALEFVGYPLTV